MDVANQKFVDKCKAMSVKELIQCRKYLMDVRLDGNNGEGDDGLENYNKCNDLIKIIDDQMREKDSRI